MAIAFLLRTFSAHWTAFNSLVSAVRECLQPIPARVRQWYHEHQLPANAHLRAEVQAIERRLRSPLASPADPTLADRQRVERLKNRMLEAMRRTATPHSNAEGTVHSIRRSHRLTNGRHDHEKKFDARTSASGMADSKGDGHHQRYPPAKKRLG